MMRQFRQIGRQILNNSNTINTVTIINPVADITVIIDAHKATDSITVAALTIRSIFITAEGMAITRDITVTGKTTPTTFISAIYIATRTDITVTDATTTNTETGLKQKLGRQCLKELSNYQYQETKKLLGK